MTRRLCLFALAALAVTAASCGSSGSSDGASPSSEPAVTTTGGASTTVAPSTPPPTTEATTTEPDATSTTAPIETPAVLPPCQDLLQEYTDVFTPDDLLPAAAFFRTYAPLMPDEVGAASLRIAAAYESVGGDMTKLNFSDTDLTADAEAFSDWTNDGCPAG